MHGMIFVELRKFVEATVGNTAWEQAHQAAGLTVIPYLPIAAYDNHVLLDLVKGLSGVTHAPVTTLLEEFGASLGPHLLVYPGIHLQKHWRTIAVLEHVETLMHKTVRRNDPTATPPRLRVHRLSFDYAELHYDSPLKLCALGKGIIRGIARHFGEQIVVTEETCMILGDPECKLSVRLRPSAPPSSREAARGVDAASSAGSVASCT
jgi:predicted hydrocarbon binding protein